MSELTDNSLDLLLLEHQDIIPLMNHVEQIKEIMQRKSPDNCIDAYLLGYMHGKRAERAKKAKRTKYQLVIKESSKKEEIEYVLVQANVKS